MVLNSTTAFLADGSPCANEITAFIAECLKLGGNSGPVLLAITSIIPDREEGATLTQTFSSVSEAVVWAVDQNTLGKNVYFQAAEPNRYVVKKMRETDALKMAHLFVDIDPPKNINQDPETLGLWQEDAISLVEKLVDTHGWDVHVIMTGGGLCVLCPLAVPLTDIPAAKLLNKRFHEAFKGIGKIDGTFSPGHLMRLPGTINWGNDAKRAKGRLPTLAKWVLSTTGHTDIGLLERTLPVIAEKIATSCANRHDYTVDAYSPEYTPLTTLLPIEMEASGDRSRDARQWMAKVLVQMCDASGRDAWQFGKDEIKNLCELAVAFGTNEAWYGHYIEKGMGKLGYDAEGALKWAVDTSIVANVARKARREKTQAAKDKGLPPDVSYDDFIAYLPDGNYCFMPTRGFWPAAPINSILPWKGFKDPMKPSIWLNKNHAVHQMTWAPGLPEIVQDAVFDPNGNWIERPNLRVLNLYRAPLVKNGDSSRAGPWLEHLKLVYPDDWPHILCCMAHRAQRPGEKINHALVLGGSPRIGKDTILEPLKWAVGASNFAEIAPDTVAGTFNGYLKSVVLRISEARDMGDINRWAFYEKTKTIIASPPDTYTVNEKHTKPYSVPNLTFVIITTNYKIGGLYLPIDDGRHYVAWSKVMRQDFAEGYFDKLWAFYNDGGVWDAVAYLLEVDLTGFNPKTPPVKTAAFFEMAESNMSEDEGELADVLQELGYPTVITLDALTNKQTALASLFADPKFTKKIASMMDRAGYSKVPNPDASSGKWFIRGAKRVVYGKQGISYREHKKAIDALI